MGRIPIFFPRQFAAETENPLSNFPQTRAGDKQQKTRIDKLRDCGKAESVSMCDGKRYNQRGGRSRRNIGCAIFTSRHFPTEWRKLPPAGTLSIGGSRAWLLYDADFTRFSYGTGSGSATLPGTGDAAYLILFGAPGATLSLNLNPGQ